ncbi:hypothetical protein Pint_31609 [Pistacia integerrima]|uniref:Uncharacterized protein n=1 Tax=Pistacia integerrima TaxID=434235 RepID=A0ACC0XMU8_9ROSI|nr:hypothetical protein Pint_31609 [Pistacia integerrima]
MVVGTLFGFDQFMNPLVDKHSGGEW